MFAVINKRKGNEAERREQNKQTKRNRQANKAKMIRILNPNMRLASQGVHYLASDILVVGSLAWGSFWGFFWFHCVFVGKCV